MDPAFRSVVDHFLWRIDQLGLPFKVYETIRTPARQAWLHKNGYSKVKTGGKHTKGLAVDLIHKEHAWKTGVERDIDLDPIRQVVIDEKLFADWQALAKLWREEFSEQLRWGGLFGYGHSGRSLIGWDPYHFEMR